MRKPLLLFIFLTIQSLAFAQLSLSALKLSNKLYTGTTEQVIKEIATELGIKIVIHEESVKPLWNSTRGMNTSLEAFLERLCRDNKLKYVVDENHVIHIFDRKANTSAVTASSEADLASTVPAESFDFTLSGYVKDVFNGETLPYASVFVKGTTLGTQTNASGFFSLVGVPSDTAVLEVRYIGYNTTLIRLNPGLPKSGIVIEVEPSSTELQEVIVAAEREDLMQIDAAEGLSLLKMSPKQMSKLPNIGEKDMMRTLQMMPGVSASNESSSGLYVRGGTPDQNLVIYDDFTVYQVDHLYGFFSAFNSNAVKDIQLYKGGFESRFGGRLSSVTEITGKDGDNKSFNAGAEMSLLGFNGFVEGPVGSRATFFLAARRSYKGPIYNKIFDKFNTSNNNTQQNNATPGPGGGPGFANFQTEASSFFYDLNSKISYRLTNRDVVSLSVFNGTDKLDNGFELDNSSLPNFGGGGQGFQRNFSVTNTDLTKYGNSGLSLKWKRTWTDRLYGSTLASYSYYFSNRDRTNSSAFTNQDGNEQSVRFGTLENNDLRDFSIKSDYTYDLSNTHHFGFGIFGSKLLIDYTFSQNDTATILDKMDRGFIGGFYLQDKMKLMKSKLSIVPGMRVSYFDITGKPYLEPRLGAAYSLAGGITVRGSTGRFYQFANRITREDILSGSRDFWILSNDDNIPVSSSEHVSFGGSYETRELLFSVEGFYKTFQNLSEYSLRYNTSPREISYEENFYNGNGYSKGMEFLAQKKFGDITGWIGYTLSQTRSKFAVYSTDYFPANHDVTHEFKAVSIYSLRRWSFSATWIFATGRPYTAPSGAYSITLLDGTTSDYFSTTDKNSLRFPNYHRFDMAATYTFMSPDRENEIGGITFSVFNLYDRTNVWYKQYSIVDSDIVETDVTYLGITPNVTLTLKLR